MTFETFEHTADVGLRIRAGSLDKLFAEAGRAFFSQIVANPEAIRPVQQVEIKLAGSRRDDLLFDWLAELLYTFATRRLLLAEFDVQVRDDGLSALARGEPIEPERHKLDLEIKAITYHGLKVEQVADGWLAEVIVDI
jgi:SHS2 domain-containing protein